MIGKTIGHYEVIEKIGAGGMGDVYRARDQRLGRQVALKFLPERALRDRDALERLLREARAASSLNHPSICTIHEFEEDGGRHFIVMELLEGETLQQMLRRGPLATWELVRLGMQIADALDAAHARGILHRDIKPANIFVTARGLAKILDFGLAKLARPAEGGTADDRTVALSDEMLTTPGMAVGTIAYMSPEQALGREIDARSDLFSLGAVLHEMATGQMAFTGSTPAAVFDAILHAAPAALAGGDPALPPELSRIIERALEKDPARRYPNAGAIGADLELLRDRAPASGRSASVTSPAPARADQSLSAREGSGPATPPRTGSVGLARTSGTLGAAAGEPASIAVLPFVNMSADPENEYFTDGMAEEIITALSKIEALRVAARTSSFAFKGKHEDVRQIGRLLSVATILEGSVRKAGNRLRISVQLVKSDDGYHLWSERYDRNLEDVFAVQDEIAESVTNALRIVLSEGERKAIEKVPTHSLEAYDLYLRGLNYMHALSDQNLRYADSMFRQAVAIDPSFALAWVGLTESCAWIYDWFERSEELRRTADDASQRALAIDPELPEAHVARGLAASMRDDLSRAVESFETAARLDPRLFDAYYFHARIYMSQGKLAEAAPLFSKAAEVRPEDYQALALAVSCLRGLGRSEEASITARRSIDVIERHLRLHPDDTRAVYLGACNWAFLGDREKTQAWARKALAMAPRDCAVRYNVACAFVIAGLVEEALDLLEENVATGWGSPEWITHDPDFHEVRDHPRFVRLLETMMRRGPSASS